MPGKRVLSVRVVRWLGPYSTCCHTFRATGYNLSAERPQLEHAQTIANHESPRTTKLYDRTREELSFEEVERINI